jgi:hypothetical protein
MAKHSGFHENYSRQDDIKVGSERAFGLVFAVVFLIIGLWPLLAELAPRYWALIVSCGFVAIALIAPKLLRPLNLIWFKFGLILHKIVNPLVMGLLFFVTITPMALIFRVMGKDTLNRQFDKSATSYWIVRNPPGPAPDTMKNQF